MENEYQSDPWKTAKNLATMLTLMWANKEKGKEAPEPISKEKKIGFTIEKNP